MKNLNIIFNIILSIAVIILFVLVLKKDKPATNTAITKENAAESQSEPLNIEEKGSSIVFVNSDSLFKHYEYFKDNQTAAEKERKSLENSIESRVTAFQKEIEEFKEKAQYMTQEQGMARQQELMEKEQKITEFRDVQSENILKKDQERADSALASVTRYLKNNYSDTRYTYILGYSLGGGILFTRDSLDITKEVLEGLNKEYQLRKKK